MHDGTFAEKFIAAEPALLAAGWKWIDFAGGRVLSAPDGCPDKNDATLWIEVRPGERVPAYAIRGGSVA